MYTSEKNLTRTIPNVEFELQVYLSEFDYLRREHEHLLNSRQQILLAVLLATITLVGLIIEKSLFINTPEVYLFIPLAFTIATWWYIRTNYSVILIDLYVLTKLQPKIQKFSSHHVFGWIDFQWNSELSKTGRFVVWTQTISKFAVVQGSAIASLYFFGKNTNWQISNWDFIAWVMIVTNAIGFAITAILLRITQVLLMRVKKAIDTFVR